jgi:hypothetical protein
LAYLGKSYRIFKLVLYLLSLLLNSRNEILHKPLATIKKLNLKKTIFFVSLILLSCKSQKINENSDNIFYNQIQGKWRVIESNILPFEHFQSCGKLGINTIFEFDDLRKMKVYSNKNMKQVCSEIQTYGLNGNNDLVIMIYDFGISYEILKLTTDSLFLKTNKVPRDLYNKSKTLVKGDAELDKINEIKNNGIIIKLTKIKNGG